MKEVLAMQGRILAFTAVLSCFAFEVQAETIERIAAVAGDEVITLHDVRNEGALRYAVKGKDIRDIDTEEDSGESLEALVKELIQVRLISREAKKNHISIGNREVDMQLNEMYQRSGQGEAAYKSMIAQEGIDWESYRSYIRSEIEAQFVMRNALMGQVSPSESDAIACAQERVPDAQNSVTVTLRQIIIPDLDVESEAGLSAPASKHLNSIWWNSLDGAVKRYATGIQALVSSDADQFVSYVHQYSTGRSVERDGLLGAFSPGDLSRDFAAVFTLKAGEVAPLIVTPSAYHIIRADEVVYGESDVWKKAVEQCREQIAMREGQRLVESWLSDLMAKSFVSILVNSDIRED